MVRTVLLLVLLTALSGCTGSSRTAGSPSASPSTATSTAPSPPAPPALGSCHRLNLDRATSQFDELAAVDCSEPHTTVTYRVGQPDRIQDGHLLAVDSDPVRSQVSRRCGAALPTYLGGTRDDVRISQLRPVYFTASVEQSDAGADWFRCDVVALNTAGQPTPLRGTLKGALARPSALDRFGTCSRIAPAKTGFAQGPCATEHGWRAVSVVPVDAGASYLGKAADAAANTACKSEASARSGGALKFTWSFVWPTREEWDAGQHYGLCWLPEQ